MGEKNLDWKMLLVPREGNWRRSFWLYTKGLFALVEPIKNGSFTMSDLVLVPLWTGVQRKIEKNLLGQQADGFGPLKWLLARAANNRPRANLNLLLPMTCMSTWRKRARSLGEQTLQTRALLRRVACSCICGYA